MAYFKDLSQYTYSGKTEDLAIFNVAWLSDEYDFPKGNLSSDVIDRIEYLSRRPVNLYRGLHYCEFCPPPAYEATRTNAVRKVIRRCPGGNGEIRISGKDGKVYSAPVLIVHYIKVHKYLPPKEFTDAISSA